MWENIKNKMLEKSRENFILDFVGKKDEILCTEDCCLVKWYDNNLNTYDEDSLSDLDFTSVNENNGNDMTVMEKYKNHKLFNVIVLHNLKIVEYDNIKNEEILPVQKDEMSFFLYTKNYLEFCKCINLGTEKRSINITNVEVFKKIYSYNYVDKNILNFIDKISYDPINYSENDKQNFIIILLYTYLYANRHNHPKKSILYQKIKNTIFLIKSNNNIQITYTGDYNIDKWLMNLKKYEDLYDESYFLNYYYQNYISKVSVEKELFSNFVGRLNKVLSGIEKKHQFNFLKRVFMMHTILYTSVNEFQIYQTIIDFFNKKILVLDTDHIKKSVLNLYLIILNNIGQVEIFNIIVSYVLKNSDKFKKNDKDICRLHLLEVRSWSQFTYFIQENVESFNNVSLGLELLFYASDNLNFNNLNGLLELVEIYLYVHDTIKIDHFFKLTKLYFRHLKNVLTILLTKCNQSSEDREILLFYNKNADQISKIILSFQRFVILSNKDNKKVKKNVSRISNSESNFHGFVNIIYKIEDVLYTQFKDQVRITKNRSFVFKNNVN